MSAWQQLYGHILGLIPSQHCSMYDPAKGSLPDLFQLQTDQGWRVLVAAIDAAVQVVAANCKAQTNLCSGQKVSIIQLLPAHMHLLLLELAHTDQLRS